MTTPFEGSNQLLLPCPAQHTATLPKTVPHLATPSPSPPHPVPNHSSTASTSQHTQHATSSVAPPAIQLEPELDSFVQAKSVATDSTNNRVLGVRSTLPSPDATPERDSVAQQPQNGALDGGENCCKNVCSETRSGAPVPQSQLQGGVYSGAVGGAEAMKGRIEMDCDEVEESQNYTPAAAESGRSSSSKDRFVNGLVGASVLAIDSIWGPPTHTHSTTSSHEASVLPLHWFVKEVLRRSRTSCSTLQVALYYLHQSRRDIRTLVAQALVEREELRDIEERIARFAEGEGEDYPTPPSSPTELSTPHSPTLTSAPTSTISQNQHQHQQSQNSLAARHASLLKSLANPLLCGRRIFLAALISASKFLQDRNYSNRAWAKISGLTVGEINRNERAFLGLVGYGLFVGAREFGCWTNRLASISLPIESVENQVPATEYPHPPITTPLASIKMEEPTLTGARISMTRSTSTPALKTSISSTPLALPALPTPALSPPSLLRTTSTTSSSSSTSSSNRPELSRQRSMKPLPKRLARSTSVSTGAENGAGISWGIMEIDGPSGVVKFSDKDRIVGPKKEEGERRVVVV